MAKTVTGTFRSQSDAGCALDRLSARGVTQDQISILMSDATRDREFAVETHSKMAEGAAVGATSGGAIGALVGGLAAVGALSVTGVGLVAVGPIVAALAGTGVGAAAGGALGGLIGLGFPEHEVKTYADEVEDGAILVAAEVDDDFAGEVKEIFNDCNAKTVSTNN